MWFLLLGIGALLNSVEFPIFANAGLSQAQIGMMMSAWGVGNLLVFWYCTIRKGSPLSLRMSGLTYLVALGLFASFSILGVLLLGFFLGGASSAMVSGEMRGQIQQNIGGSLDSIKVWAFSNQGLCLINLIFYGGFGWASKHVPISVFSALLLAMTGLFVYLATKVQKATLAA